jgi:hypothetical protein
MQYFFILFLAQSYLNSSQRECRIMPEDTAIYGPTLSDNGSEKKEGFMSLEEFDQMVREWVNKLLMNIEPPPWIWDKIENRAKRRKATENSC